MMVALRFLFLTAMFFLSRSLNWIQKSLKPEGFSDSMRPDGCTFDGVVSRRRAGRAQRTPVCSDVACSAQRRAARTSAPQMFEEP